MKNQKLFIMLILAVLLGLGTFGFSQNFAGSKTKNVKASCENVRPLGRTLNMNDSLFLCFSSTGIEFNVKARHLEINFVTDSGTNGSLKDSSPRIIALLNGERIADEMIIAKNQSVLIFDYKENVEGLVQILKVSESAQSLLGIESLTLDAKVEISPSAQRKTKIEFIGDSITCGYGVDDLNKNHHFKTSTEDSTKTYAFKTAAALEADWSFVSASGWGIISGYSGDGKKYSNMQIPAVYDRLGVSWGSTINGMNPVEKVWNFDYFKPDVVVVNLGTNDASYTKGRADRCEEFKTAYVDFIKKIREKNPDAYIICSLGIMGGDLYSYISQAVAEYSVATGDRRLSAFKFDNQNSADGIAADWHPSEKTHSKAATKLVMKIREVL